MNKYVIEIDGMKCGMCEMHVEETIAKKCHVKKIKASYTKNQVVVFSKDNLNEEDFKKALDVTGYRVTSYSRSLATKKFLGWK